MHFVRMLAAQPTICYFKGLWELNYGNVDGNGERLYRN